MSEFKAGDRIRVVIDDPGDNVRIGSLGTVVGKLTERGEYTVFLDNDSQDQPPVFLWPNDMELLEG